MGRILAAVLAVVVVTGTGAAKRPKPTLCPDGRFAVQQGPLLPGGPPDDEVVVANPTVALTSGCPAIAAKLRATRKGTRLRAAWPSCPGVTGPVRVRAVIATACDAMTGKVKARKAHVKRAFTATREGATTTTTTVVGSTTTTTFAGVVAPGPTHGSAVALTQNDARALVVNRDAGTVTLLTTVTPPVVVAEVDLGAGSEPWQVAVSPDGTTGYVVLRKAQTLVEITSLGGVPAVGRQVAVGSEPTSVALTPTGAHAWVANWVDGTLTEVDTATMTVASTVDLNAALAATSFPGAIPSRPALAHPRAIAITNDGDGDDTDETLYATEFFAWRLFPEASDGSNADVAKVGLVYRVPLATRVPLLLSVDPLADMGFKDEHNVAAGCYPTQLGSITIEGGFAYVLSVCASPRGPIGAKVTATACTSAANCAGLVDPVCAAQTAGAAKVCVDVADVKTTTAPLLTVLDLATGLVASAVNLDALVLPIYSGSADDPTHRLPLAATDLAFVSPSVGFLTANGVDTVFRLTFDPATGAATGAGSQLGKFIPLDPAGAGPIGLAIKRAGDAVLVADDLTRSVSRIDLASQAVSDTVPTSVLPTVGSAADHVRKGKRFFETGLGRWSLHGQGWGACQSCHPDGLTDNVTWYFARGPRQSISLDGSFASQDPTDQRIFNWTAVSDEVADFELNARGVSGGVGAIVSAVSSPPAATDRIDLVGLGHSGLDGSATDAASVANPLGLSAGSQLDAWTDVTTYLQSIRSPRAPTTLNPADVAAGRTIFTTEGACQGCHGGAKWTVSRRFYTPSTATGVGLQSTSWNAAVTGSGFPALLLPATTVANRVMRFGDATTDQILCALRPVGTFGLAPAAEGIAEVRSDMLTAAQGNGDANGDGKGYNPPSLLGLATGAPYFHAGNSRTLELLLLSSTFAAHRGALAPVFLPDQTTARQLVAFLLSIDEDTPPVAIPSLGPQGGTFCQFP